MSNSVRGALIISSSERYVIFIVNFMTLAIVSRLLTPKEVGLAVLGTAALSITEAIRDFGASSYLVQHRNVTPEIIRTAFTVTLLLTVVIFLTIVASAELIAAFYKDENLVPYLRIIGASFLASPYSGTIMALMRRDLEFGRLAIVNVVGQSVGAFVTISLAALGASYLSIAWGVLAMSATTAALAIFMRPDFGVLRPLIGDWRSVLHFGGISSATTLINQGYNMLPALVMGRVLPMASVGLFSRSQSICQLADKLVFGSIGPVALSAFSREVREGRSLKEAYLRGLSYLTAIYWPILCLLALLAHTVVEVVLGRQWLEAVPMVQVMAIASLFFFPAVLSYPILVAAGGVADTLRATLISLPPSACIIGFAATVSPFAVAASQLVTIPLQVIVVMWFIRGRLDFNWKEFFGAVRTSAIVTAASLATPGMIVVASGGGGQVGLPVAALAVVGAGAGWLAAVFATSHILRVEIEFAAGVLSGQLRRVRTALGTSDERCG